MAMERANDAMSTTNTYQHQLNHTELGGCSKCRPQVAKLAPGWFYNSATRQVGKLPQLGLHETDLQRTGATLTIPEEERLGRVQEWLTRLNKGGEEDGNNPTRKPKVIKKTHIVAKTQGGEGLGVAKTQRGGANIGTNNPDSNNTRNWYMNKNTRTSVTSLYDASEKTLQSQKQNHFNTGPSTKTNLLEPIDGHSVISGSHNGSGSGYHQILNAQDVLMYTAPKRTSILPEDDLVRNYIERKQKLGAFRLDRSFSKTQFLTEGQSSRSVGPIARPHSPVRSLTARQKTLLGDAWFTKGTPGGGQRNNSGVHQMQNRTYELQAQLKQMLDRQTQ